MFLPTGFIGHARQTFKGRECLTWSEVRELHGEGIEFGSHTVSHRVLNRLPWSEVQRELLDSRLRIEDELQVPISTFAYPFAFPREDGPFIARFREELACQGYSAAVTTVIGRAGRRSDALCLERLPVNDADDETLFEAKLLGAYDWLGAVQSVVRSAKHAVRPTAVPS
jgi:peptidoglycan/xylan/chitin deacetylase (PgdA/CDA1 family)